MTPSSRERRKEALEWAIVVADDFPPGLRPLRHAATLREMLEEMSEKLKPVKKVHFRKDEYSVACGHAAHAVDNFRDWGYVTCKQCLRSESKGNGSGKGEGA